MKRSSADESPRSPTPPLSVGLPVYNGERFLPETIESIIGQTFTDIEIVISDNGSTDATEMICRDYAATEPRIRYFRSPTNHGAAWNFNRVFRMSRGRYFKWWAADDLCAPTLLERCLTTLQRRPDAVLAYARNRWIDAEGRVIRNDAKIIRQEPWPADPVRRYGAFLFDFARQGGRIGPVYVFGVMRSEAVRATRLLGKYPGADINFLSELSLAGQFVEVPEYLSHIRTHPDSLSWEYMRDPEKVYRFWDPQMRRGFVRTLSRARTYGEFFVSVGRSELAWRDKALLATLTFAADLRCFWDRFLVAAGRPQRLDD